MCKFMKFFLDTASLEEIEKWKPYGIVNGVTTNPSLLSKENCNALERLKQITAIVEGPVTAQVTSTFHEKMILQAKSLAKLANNILIKLPATSEGFLAAKELVKNEISCNITLTFDPAQAIQFCLLPVNYVSLILGRTEDFGIRDLNRVKQLRDIIDNLNSKTKLLSASIRNSQHLIAAILGHSDVITVPPNTWKNIYQNPLTLIGEKDFLDSWKSLPETLRETYEKQ